MRQVGITLDALHFRLDDVKHFILYGDEMVLNFLISDVSDFGQWLVCFLLRVNSWEVQVQPAVKGFVFNALIWVVGHKANELPGGQVGDPAGRHRQVQLCIAGHGGILAVNGNTFSLLDDFSDAVADKFGSIAHRLAAEDVRTNVHDHFCLFAGIIFFELRVILDS